MSSSSPEGRVAKHFDVHAQDFDSIYDTEKGRLRTLRDRLSRGTVIKRLDLANELADERKPSRVLDIGCGSGRFAVSLARRGATVVGLDFAPEMLSLAEKKADEAGVADRCQFLNADFMTWDWDEPFDLVLAIGVLDYVPRPEPFMKRLATASRGLSVVSFPLRLHPLVPIRIARLRLKGCPVFFYNRQQVEALARASFKRWEIRRLERDLILLGHEPCV